METIDFLTCRKLLNELGFKDKEINIAFNNLNITKKDLCSREGFLQIPTQYEIKEFDKKGIVSYKEYLGSYYRYIIKEGEYWLIPSCFQGLKHGAIIFELLKSRFDWFDTFNKIVIKNIEPKINKQTKVKDISKDLGDMSISDIIEILDKKQEIKETESLWKLYEMHNIDYELYLLTEFGSLYVPIIALLNKDFSIIEKRMINYFNWYNRTSGSKEEIQKKNKKSLKPLNSKEAKQLKNYLILY